MSIPIILASQSAIRAALLKNAGVAFRAVRPAADEERLKDRARAEGLGPEETALFLAREKALSIAAPGALVIGADQILEFEGRAFDKPRTMAEAAARLLQMQGAAHTLINALVVARDGEIRFENLSRPVLRMRAMGTRDIEAYLERAGEGALASVGAYQVEGAGAQLFEGIDGDYFAVLGLALFPLLAALRREGAKGF